MLMGKHFKGYTFYQSNQMVNTAHVFSASDSKQAGTCVMSSYTLWQLHWGILSPSWTSGQKYGQHSNCHKCRPQSAELEFNIHGNTIFFSLQLPTSPNSQIKTNLFVKQIWSIDHITCSKLPVVKFLRMHFRLNSQKASKGQESHAKSLTWRSSLVDVSLWEVPKILKFLHMPGNSLSHAPGKAAQNSSGSNFWRE